MHGGGTLICVLVLDTAAVPVRDRLSLVVESVVVAAHATSFKSHADKGAAHLTMNVWQSAGVEVFDTACSAHTMRRVGQPSSDEEPALMLTYALKGVGIHRQPGREVAVRPSTFWATDLSASYEHRISDTRTLTAKLSNDALGMSVDFIRPALEHLHKSPIAPLFTNHVREVRRVAGQVDEATAVSLGTATLSLARALLASVAPDSRVGRDALEGALLLRVKAFVREHLADPGLNAESIAAAHFVSVRHLYKVCADGGLRLGQWIIEERLARAAEDLSRRTSPGMTVSQVAHRWGFTSPAHFATRFRRAYGVSPREWQAINEPPPS